jgi:hypothetical protein
MKGATDALNESMQKIGQAVYQKQEQAPPPPPDQQTPPPGGEGGQGTVEGEFREV